jgi:hypothetical protein
VGGVAVVESFGRKEQEAKKSDSPAMYENDMSVGGELVKEWMAPYELGRSSGLAMAGGAVRQYFERRIL